MKNKATKNEKFRAGVLNFKTLSGYFNMPSKDPLMFANSGEFKKIKNRNKKR